MPDPRNTQLQRAAESATGDDADFRCEPIRAIERLGNMRPLYANVVGRFLDDSAGNFHKLIEAIANDDYPVIHQSAHSLKGLAAMCGAVGVGELLGELETASSSEVRPLLERLQPAMDKTRDLLSPYRDPSNT